MEINFNLINPADIETTDDKGRKYSGMAGFIESELNTLLGYQKRKDTPGLREDIAVYRHMLKSSEPETMVRLYMNKKMEFHDKRIYPDKMQIAEALGWDVKP